jgi:CRP-like cAMP-binding protein
MTTSDHQQLRNFTIFRDLSDEVLAELVKHCQEIELGAGETLFQQNHPGDFLYLLVDGQIHIVREYPDGEQVILATEGPYYAIGDLSMLASYPRTGAVVAVSDCSMIAIEREVFFEVCRRVPEVAIEMIVYLARRLHRLNLQVREYAISNIAARVASVLWLLSGGEAGVVSSTVRVSRIARAVATDADKVERILNEWTTAGYISYDGKQVEIHDLDMIRNIAG